MDITIKGCGKPIKLNKNTFISSGGEGSIFASNGMAFKIYTNPKALIPYAKIQELSVITNSNVIKPEQIILDNRQKPIGYTMKYVSDTYSLCQIFPKAFRDRVGLDIDTVLKLIKKMQTTIADIHKIPGMLIVDLNEMNFLVDKKFKDIYFIDVDSYKTFSFPATAIMESIRDWNSSEFNHLTDWYSFGVVSFEMFIGIHPFKGKHSSIKGIKDRMLANIPVFHKDVSFPQVCLPFNVIPQAYKEWYKALFYEGKRIPPPSDAVQTIVIPVVVQTITGNEDFEISEIFEYNSNIIKFLSVDGVRVTVTVKSIYINNKLIPDTEIKDAHIASTNKTIVVHKNNGSLSLFNLSDKTVLEEQISVEDIMSYKGRVFVKNKDILSELECIKMGTNIHVVPHPIANVMENATKLFEGVIIQNVLGAFMASIFPSYGTHYQIQCLEFKGYQIIDAKYDSNVLIVIGSKSGKYDKFILKFDEKFSSYSLRKVDDISYCGINFTVLDNGVVVHINENEEIEIFTNKKDSNKVKIVDSSIISGDMKLFNDGVKVVFAKGKKLYKLSMK
jgi:serine/threonine protein kinase